MKDGGVIESKGPEHFAEAAPAVTEEAVVWVSDENPTDDPEVFRVLAAQMSPLQG